MVIGAPSNDENGIDSGSAYVFEHDSAGVWNQVTKLVAGDAAAFDRFGDSVAISRDWVVIGARRDNDNGIDSGSAYVFERDAGGTWTGVQKLVAGDGAVGDDFGISVAITGDRAVIGANFDDVTGVNSGSAYVFERNAAGTWIGVQKLISGDAVAGDQFGWSVAISGNRALIGAPYDNNNDFFDDDFGSAYVFERNVGGTWNQVAKLLASDGSGFVQFGWSVGISGDGAVIGARRGDGTSNLSGLAYVFERNAGGAWAEVQKLLASDFTVGASFGASVAISGERAVIGAPNKGDQGLFSGAAYIFEQPIVFVGSAPAGLAGVEVNGDRALK